MSLWPGGGRRTCNTSNRNCCADGQASSRQHSPATGHLHSAMAPAWCCGVQHSLLWTPKESKTVPPCDPQTIHRGSISPCMHPMHPSSTVQATEHDHASLKQPGDSDPMGAASTPVQGISNATAVGHGQNELLNELLLKLQQEDSSAVNDDGDALRVCLLSTCSVSRPTQQLQPCVVREEERQVLLKRKRELHEVRSCSGWGPSLGSLPLGITGDSGSSGGSPPSRASEPRATRHVVVDSAAGSLLRGEELRSLPSVWQQRWPSLQSVLVQSAEQQLFAAWGGCARDGNCGEMEAPIADPVANRVLHGGTLGGKSWDSGLAPGLHKDGSVVAEALTWMAQMSQDDEVTCDIITSTYNGASTAEMTDTSSSGTGMALGPDGRALAGREARLCAAGPGTYPVPPAEGLEHKVRCGSTGGAPRRTLLRLGRLGTVAPRSPFLY
jgi:hypothetical protein